MKIFLSILLTIACTGAAAQTNPCLIPGYPGCSQSDFYSALEAEQARNLLQNQLQQQRRRNELLEEQNELLRGQFPPPIYPTLNYQELQRQRCMTMPLRTPGC